MGNLGYLAFGIIPWRHDVYRQRRDCVDRVGRKETPRRPAITGLILSVPPALGGVHLLYDSQGGQGSCWEWGLLRSSWSQIARNYHALDHSTFLPKIGASTQSCRVRCGRVVREVFPHASRLTDHETVDLALSLFGPLHFGRHTQPLTRAGLIIVDDTHWWPGPNPPHPIPPRPVPPWPPRPRPEPRPYIFAPMEVSYVKVNTRINDQIATTSSTRNL